MIRYLLIFIILQAGMIGLFGQSLDRHVVGTTSDNLTIGGTEYSFSFGEAIIGTTASSPILTKGFLQPDSIIILSIKLVALGARKVEDGIAVAWRLTDNAEGGHFIIERAQDNQIFEEVGSMDFREDNSLKYEFRDPSFYVDNQSIVYRVKYFASDGRTLVSDRMEVLPEASISMRVFPNPATDWIQIEYVMANESNHIQLALSDIFGKLVWEKSVLHTGSFLYEKVNVSTLAPGIYTLSIAHDYGISSEKIVIRRE